MALLDCRNPHLFGNHPTNILRPRRVLPSSRRGPCCGDQSNRVDLGMALSNPLGFLALANYIRRENLAFARHLSVYQFTLDATVLHGGDIDFCRSQNDALLYGAVCHLWSYVQLPLLEPVIVVQLLRLLKANNEHAWIGTVRHCNQLLPNRHETRQHGLPPRWRHCNSSQTYGDCSVCAALLVPVLDKSGKVWVIDKDNTAVHSSAAWLVHFWYHVVPQSGSQHNF